MKQCYTLFSAIAIFLFCGLEVIAQDGMGIGNNNPLEMLDVSGAIKIGTDNTNSTAAPTGGAGTVRFRAGIFEGWDGSAWTPFGGGGSSVAFETTSNITSNSPGTVATDDFVFGSTQLANATGTNDDSRFFFDKSKSAFRAGVVDGTQWDDANVGTNSISLGYRTTASGNASFAVGQYGQATGNDAIAMGYNANASDAGAIAFGTNSVASGNTSFAGPFSTASALSATSMGFNSTASGQYSMVMGTYYSVASGSYSSVFGIGTASGYASSALGYYSNASGNYSLAAGTYYASASGDYSTALGWSYATGYGAMAMGNYSTAGGERSTAMGSATTASGYASTSMGRETEASGAYSTSMGYGSTASGTTSLVAGSFSGASGDYATALGANAYANGDYSSSIGNETFATGTYSTAMGVNTTASAERSTSIGSNSFASGFGSSALGMGLRAKSFGETTLGLYNTDYTPASTTAWNASDRLLVVGNGTSNVARSNALTVYKDGTLNVNDAFSLPNTDGTAGYVMSTDGSGSVSWTDPGTLVSTGPFSSTSFVISNSASGLYLEDFVFGSPQLDHSTNANYHSRYFFDKGKGAFRAGTTSGTEWNNANLGPNSVAFGQNTIASGVNSSSFGLFNTASGPMSVAAGNGSIASGFYSLALGRGVLARSSAEVVVGVWNNDYTPSSSQNWNFSDRLFVVGNGTGAVPANRSNALTIYKNGTMNINDAYNMPTADGAAGYVMSTNGSGVVSFIDPTTLNTSNDGDWTVNGNDIYSAVSGNVGIGITNPTNQLHVRNSSFHSGAVFDAASGFASYIDFQEAGVKRANIYWNGTNDILMLNDVVTSNTAINSNGGNVGIGTLTPDRQLNVESTTGGQLMFSRADGNTTTGELMGEILFDNTDNTAVSSVDAAVVIRASAEGNQGNSNKGGYLSILTKDNADGSAAATERMRVAADGNVGIGTNAPSAKLDLEGTFQLKDGTEGANKVLTSDASGNATWETPTGGTSPTATYGETVLSGDFAFATNSLWQNTGLTITLPSAGTYRVYFTAAGRVNPTTNDIMSVRLYDVTGAAVVANSEAMVGRGFNAIWEFGQCSNESFVTVTGSTTYRLEGKLHAGGGSSHLYSNGTYGRTKITYIKIN